MEQSQRHIKIKTLNRIRLIGIIAISILISGCAKTIYVPVENIRTEYKDRLQRDSILLYDSVFVKLTNDTVWMEKYKFTYRNNIIRDSVYINDTIRVPYPVVEYKEVNKLKGWQNFLIWSGGICIGFFIFYLIIRYFRK